MGICIAYTGALRDPALIPELISDLAARARHAGWRFKTMNELLAEGLVNSPGLQGITLYPHEECEPVHFHFDEEGNFINHTYHELLNDPKKAKKMRRALRESIAWSQGLDPSTLKSRGRARSKGGGEGPGEDLFKKGSRYNWTKTQFAGAEVHVAVCGVLRHVKERYAPALDVRDESGYFDEGDYEKLEAQLAYIDHLSEITSRAIEAAAARGPTTLEAFVEHINEELAEAKSRLH